MLICALFIFILSLLRQSDGAPCSVDNNLKPKEVLLHENLLCQYSTDVRPVKDHKSAVNVTVRMVLKTMEYSRSWSSTDVITIGSWIVLQWKDEFLTWDPKQYDGIDQTVFQSTKIWLPDFSLYNSDQVTSSRFDTHCLVQSTGKVICIPHKKMSAVCSNDYAKWPYDRQNCTLTFGNWMLKGEEVNFFLSKNPINKQDYVGNRYWNLVSADATRHHGVYSGYNDTFPTLRFWFYVKRHSAAINALVIPPALVMITLSIITLCLNIESIERLVLMVMNVYCHFVFLDRSGMVPDNGDTIPNAVKYFRDSFFLSVIILLHGLCLRSISKKSTVAPQWVGAITGLTSTGPGKIIMFNEFDPSNSNAMADDTENLTKTEMEVTANKEWRLFALFVNRVFFIITTLTYLGLILAYLL